MISVSSDETSVRVTIPKDELPPQRLNQFLDWLRLESVVSHNDLSESEADRLAEEAKTAWWNASKETLIGPERE